MKYFLAMLSIALLAACGGGGGSTANSNFDPASNDPIQPATSIDVDDGEQVITIEAGADGQNGSIGLIEEQTPDRVLCVIIDSAAGTDADLEVCAAERANNDSSSVNGICPEADRETRCASVNVGSGPDFCVVTGASDYVFVMLNLTEEDVTVAFQVIDVTDQPNQSCDDLNITEDSITADDA